MGKLIKPLGTNQSSQSENQTRRDAAGEQEEEGEATEWSDPLDQLRDCLEPDIARLVQERETPIPPHQGRAAAGGSSNWLWWPFSQNQPQE